MPAEPPNNGSDGTKNVEECRQPTTRETDDDGRGVVYYFYLIVIYTKLRTYPGDKNTKKENNKTMVQTILFFLGVFSIFKKCLTKISVEIVRLAAGAALDHIASSTRKVIADSTNKLIYVKWQILLFSFGWVGREVATIIIEKFEKLEENRMKMRFRGTDRRSSAPFISGDGFRSNCSHSCEESNRCRMNPLAVSNGSCVFVKSDFFDFFAKEVANRIPGRYIIVSHNGDLSTPDGQNDSPRIGMQKYVTTDVLRKEYAAGRLIAHHGQNLWWVNNTFTPRPAFSHCLPIGIENRQYAIGRNVRVYAEALRRNIVKKPQLSLTQRDKLPLLLVAFYPKSRVPDRQKVLAALGALPPRGKPKSINPWYNETDLNHIEWLDSIRQHKFVLAPFGHGLDTHRVTEILLMGGFPVMRRSTISSCYDDSDNAFGSSTRGSLPIVLLDSWSDLTQSRLEAEWARLSKIPASHWDWRRLLLDHWLERIGCKDDDKGHFLK